MISLSNQLRRNWLHHEMRREDAHRPRGHAGIDDSARNPILQKRFKSAGGDDRDAGDHGEQIGRLDRAETRQAQRKHGHGEQESAHAHRRDDLA